MNWREDLDPDAQERIRGLEASGCEFFWRESFESLAQQSPLSEDPHIFEIWRSGRLLDYIHPIQHPFDLLSLINLEGFILHEWKRHFFMH